jgi:Cu+-exporting ATPase
MSAALRIFDKNKFYLKNTAVVEHIAAIDTLVFDKTGTITLTNKNEMSFIGELSLEDQWLVYQVCNQSSHPLSRKICEYLALEDKQIIENFKEITGFGLSATFQNKEILIGSANFVVGAKTNYESNCPTVHISINNTYLGYFIFEQKIRPGFEEVLRQLKSNYQTFLLSGDQKQELALFQKTFHQKDNLFFNQTPQNKLDFVLHQQQQNRKVLMLGDGLNDAGALKQSDVGIAITDNINNFTPGSDAILDGKALILLPNFIAFAKSSVKIIHISFCIAIVYNVVGISFAIQGKLSPLIAAILMPVSTLTIISFTSIASYLSAIKHQLKQP